MSGATALAGFLLGDANLMWPALLMCATLVGFLRYNRNPASIFLGDSGSLTIGLTLGCLAIVWSNHETMGIARFAPALVWAVPLLDLALSVLRRFIRGAPVFSPDRGHIHYQLLDRGFTTQEVATNLCAASAVAGLSGLVVSFAPEPINLLAAAIVIVGVLWGSVEAQICGVWRSC